MDNTKLKQNIKKFGSFVKITYSDGTIERHGIFPNVVLKIKCDDGFPFREGTLKIYDPEGYVNLSHVRKIELFEEL